MSIKTKARPETILLKGSPILKEAQASTAIMPGQLLSLTAEGHVAVQSTQGENCRRAFAHEDDLQGKTYLQPYAIGDRVRYAVYKSGEELQTTVKAGASAIVTGEALQADGSGGVEKHADGAIIGFALESIDNSSGTDSTNLIMEVL